MAVEARELVKRLRMMCWLGEEGNELLAEAVEMLGLSGTVPVPRIEDWLRRVAEATEGGEDESLAVAHEPRTANGADGEGSRGRPPA